MLCVAGRLNRAWALPCPGVTSSTTSKILVRYILLLYPPRTWGTWPNAALTGSGELSSYSKEHPCKIVGTSNMRYQYIVRAFWNVVKTCGCGLALMQCWSAQHRVRYRLRSVEDLVAPTITRTHSREALCHQIEWRPMDDLHIHILTRVGPPIRRRNEVLR